MSESSFWKASSAMCCELGKAQSSCWVPARCFAGQGCGLVPYFLLLCLSRSQPVLHAARRVHNPPWTKVRPWGFQNTLGFVLLLGLFQPGGPHETISFVQRQKQEWLGDRDVMFPTAPELGSHGGAMAGYPTQHHRMS